MAVDYMRRPGATGPAFFDDKLKRDRRAFRNLGHHMDDGVHVVEKLDLVLHFEPPVGPNRVAETSDYNASRSRSQCYERRMDLAPASVFDRLAAMQRPSESCSDVILRLVDLQAR